MLSDILHNSSAPIPNASSYRSLFQVELPSIFLSLHRSHVKSMSDAGRITADAIRGKVTLLFKAWNQWAIFPQQFLNKLEYTFQKGEEGQNEGANNGSNGTA